MAYTNDTFGGRRPRCVAKSPLATAGRAALLALLLAAVAALGGCGYSQEVPGLPAGAERLAIAPVQNGTFESELDIRLREALDQRLRRHAHVRLVSRERADLVVETTLKSLTITRTVDIIPPRRKLLGFKLAGRASILDRRNGEYLVQDNTIRANAEVAVDTEALETPAVRYDGIDKAVAAFADQVEAMLLRHF